MNSMRYGRRSRMADYEVSGGVQHPMLLHGAGTAVIVGACSSAVNALALSVTMLVLCVAMSVVYMFERGEYMQPMRSVVYFVPSAMLVCGCGIVIDSLAPTAAESIGMYLPIMAADSLALARLQADAPFVPPNQALPEALRLWWLYAVMSLPIGILREIMGRGTVFGFSFLIKTNAQGMELPFAGFIMLGFGLAIYRKRHGSQQ